jgi:rhodanese-related sulfurtransferase
MEGQKVALIAIVVCLVVLCPMLVIWIRRTRDRRVLEQHCITPEELRALLTSNQDILLLDVRQPLDLLGDTEIIPGAKRIPPRDIIENPSLIPREKDLVAYCTCPGDKSSRAVTHQALALHIDRVRFLKGGLAGWKAKGYPVEPYQETFHLDNVT